MPTENGKTLKDYTESARTESEAPRMSSPPTRVPVSVADSSVVHPSGGQSIPNRGGTPIRVFCWKDGVVGTVEFTSNSGFKPLPT